MRDALTIMIVFGVMISLALHEFVAFLRDLLKTGPSRTAYTELKPAGLGDPLPKKQPDLVVIDVTPKAELPAGAIKRRKYTVNVEACQQYLSK
jgi:hypothetical protein